MPTTEALTTLVIFLHFACQKHVLLVAYSRLLYDSVFSILEQFGKVQAAGTYVSETVSTADDTLYVAASTDIFVNYSAYDQITSASTKFHGISWY